MGLTDFTITNIAKSTALSPDDDKTKNKEDEADHSHRGFSWIIASIFIVGETAGSGMVALPAATMNAGFIGGSVLLILMCVLLGYTASLLGKNWLIMQKLWPKYKTEPCRNPYPEMGRKAMGRGAEYLVNISSYLTLFGGMAVFSILASKNISDLLSLFNIRVHFCIILSALALGIWPFTMLRSPAHFWQVSIVAASATALAVVILLVGVSIDSPMCLSEVKYSEFSLSKLSLSFGTMIFSYSGHPVLPTIQHDMKKPEHFQKAVILGYIAMFFLYAPISMLGYAVYGNSLSDTITVSIQTLVLRHIVNVMVTIHVLFSIIVIGNPVLQGVEQVFKVQDKMGSGRFVVRSIIFFAAIFIAATLPDFGIFLDLIGGSSMTILSIILPGLFSLYLEAAEKKRESSNDDQVAMPTFAEVIHLTPLKRLLVEFSIIAFGGLCGIICTVNTLRQIPNSSFSTPCYLDLIRGASFTNSPSLTRCCGEFHNITANSDRFFCGI
ncbi:unnamed protein product [Auanema sp. JU1783]|nr:unnamed protein product [Auanema sp. JU1783]